MKRILLVLILVVSSSALSSAQVRPQYMPSPENGNPETIMWNAEYARLLDDQNHKLDSRKYAMIISLSGAAVTFTGAVVGVMTAESNYDGTVSIGTPGTAIMAVGELVTAVGGIWLLINEFNMIKAQQRINDHLILKYGPSGVALTF
ncbi:MAG: hypothetical protein J5699_04085 [Bacteroidales bacterium]|nr:hypothetical protein [Bacteroidales bacterium]